LGANYRLRFAGLAKEAHSAQQIGICGLESYRNVAVGPSDLVLVAGLRSVKISKTELREWGPQFFTWLRQCHARKATIGSVCTAAFILAEAGLLDHRQCTTHWTMTESLARHYPRLRVLPNRLFVKDGGVLTSAGICSGIDMALALVESDMGAAFVAKVAQMLVFYIRRDSHHPQADMALRFRDHLDARIHQVQDMVAKDLARPQTLETLAECAHMSTRHLTRLFRAATGITINAYTTLLRLEKAGQLLGQTSLSIEQIASRCGFSDARQFRKIYQRHHGCSPSRRRRSSMG